MARIGFLSHADMSIYFFRSPIMRALQELGHEVFAICPDGEFAKRLKSEFNVVTYELDRASLNPLVVLKNSQKLSLVLKNLNLDLLQTSAHKSNVFGTFAAKKAGIKRVINLVEGLGSFYIDDDLKTKLVRFGIEILYKKALGLSDGCVFVNDSDPNYFESKGLIKKEKIFKIKSVGVNTDKFDPDAVTSANLGEKKIVLMIARAMWHKGVREFYEAAQILKDRTDCEFVYVGESFDGNSSTADIKFLTSGNVLYLGARDDVAGLLKASYMLVLPSYKEGFPRTILEAMSMAKAVVASDVTGCNEAVLSGVNGLLCKVADAKSLAEKIQSLLDDEILAKRLGENGRQMVLEQFDERIIAEKYIELYRKFIDV
ncbi:glycosyltransferase family 4 protein [Campylobacter suis]|uniref:N, N'-diacetylbacillosaminyl-diphospho-undecaprenol alpha-1,3-N-acetylgalactosaminyltransferase n=1 Tax=Campylobacter suis TaxID=2790657 RepID=A0ABM8Q762_9BACT|nr:glycosyltransferase family 4 protein [Campylobacter suis]CAD7288784.1 N, N'-diacetylbacillosaminyl-diphospho-undecaprenol alpha-1,3-N-acetylgalactosaminyltransferase [Campylobacter suis]